MSDDISGLPQHPDPGVSAGEPAVSEAPATPPEPAKLRLEETEAWQRAQSAYDRQIAAKERENEQLRQQMQGLYRDGQLTKQQLSEVLTLIKEGDPKGAQTLEQRLVASAAAQENQALAQENLYYKRRDEWTDWADDNGLDVKDPAVRQALRSLNTDALVEMVEQRKVEERAKQLAAEMLKQQPAPAAPAPAPSPEPAPAAPPAAPRHPVPPSGGSRPSHLSESERERLSQERLALSADRTKNRARLDEIDQLLRS